MPGQTTFSTKFGFLIAKNHLDIELLLVFSDDSAYFLILRNVRQVTRQAIQNQNSVHSKTSTRYNTDVLSYSDTVWTPGQSVTVGKRHYNHAYLL